MLYPNRRWVSLVAIQTKKHPRDPTLLPLQAKAQKFLRLQLPRTLPHLSPPPAHPRPSLWYATDYNSTMDIICFHVPQFFCMNFVSVDSYVWMLSANLTLTRTLVCHWQRRRRCCVRQCGKGQAYTAHPPPAKRIPIKPGRI